jgi:hypothetical protein
VTDVPETALHEIRTLGFLPAIVERGLNATLSRGPGYEPTPLGSTFDAASVRGYYIDFSSKTRSSIASDTDRILPVALVQLALGWWERRMAGDADAETEFLDLCHLLEARGTGDGEELRWPQNVAVSKYGLVPGWCSALTQGQSASAFVRAYVVTNDDRWAELARRAAAPLLSPRSSDLVTRSRVGPILEEVPSIPGSHILNGWISALWGVWDVRLGLGDARAGREFEDGIESLRLHLPAYDAGWWSRYSLYPHSLQDLAKPIYHRYHVAQLRATHRLTGLNEFAETAARWEAADRPIHAALAVAQKGCFALADGRRRQRASAAQQH